MSRDSQRHEDYNKGRDVDGEDQNNNRNEKRPRDRNNRDSRSRSRSNSRGRARGGRGRSNSRSRSRSRGRYNQRDNQRDRGGRDERSKFSSNRRDKSNSRSPPVSRPPRKKGMWDQAPPGFEGMSVAQVATLNPAVLTPLITPANTLLQSRQARRLYVGNVPLSVGDPEVMEFFNAAMVAAKLVPVGVTSVVGCQMNHEKNYAFIEFRTPEEATSAMAFDGMTLQNNILKIRRPKDYVAPSGSPTHPAPVTSPLREEVDSPSGHIPGIIATNVQDSQSKVYLGGLPPYLTADQVKELVSTFGQLKSFHLVMESPIMSKGYAFLEYLDDHVTDRACSGLNGMQIGDKTLAMHRASSSTSTPSNPSASPPSASQAAPPAPTPNVPSSNPLLTATLLGMPYMGATNPPPPTSTLLLLNMASMDEILQDYEHQSMVADVQAECAKIGTVKAVTIPRAHGKNATLLVKVFVQYENKDDAYKAHQTIGGRRYNGRTIVSHFVDDATDFSLLVQ